MGEQVTAFIALGSNLQDPPRQLNLALTALAALPETQLIAVSSFYRSTAVGPGEQPDYLNAVARLQTTLSPTLLLEKLQTIETQQGRTRETRWGPRTLDLDIVLYGTQVINTPDLHIPHPRMHERDFVLYPLREISDTATLLPNGSDLETLISQLPATTIAMTQHKHPLQRDTGAFSPQEEERALPEGRRD